MLAFLLGLFRMVWLFGKNHRGVVLENLALRQQLSIYKRKHKRPRFVDRDRWFLGHAVRTVEGLAACLGRRPSDTVVRWQRRTVSVGTGTTCPRDRKDWPTADQPSDSEADSGLSRSEPVLACTPNSRRTTQARIAVSERTVSRVCKPSSDLRRRPGGHS